jgi:hypothetical protein
MNENLFHHAQRSSEAIATFCDHYNIVLNKHVLRYALLEQLLEEAALSSEERLPASIIYWPINMIERFIEQRHEGIDHYGLRLRVWHLLYRYHDQLFLTQSDFITTRQEQVEADTLFDILRLPCFQDDFSSYMGQKIAYLPLDEETAEWLTHLDLPSTWDDMMSTNPSSQQDVIDLNLPELYLEEEEVVEGAFPALNKGLEDAVKQVLEGERFLENHHPFKRLFSSFQRPKDK